MPTRSQITFIATWRSLVGSDGLVLWDAGRDDPFPGRLHGLADCRPGHRVNTSVYVLTPVGADLIATADAIGFDPEEARADDEPAACPTCDDAREVKMATDDTVRWVTGPKAIEGILHAAVRDKREVEVRFIGGDGIKIGDSYSGLVQVQVCAFDVGEWRFCIDGEHGIFRPLITAVRFRVAS